MNKKWWKEGIVYQIYPRSYFDSNNDGIGDIRGIIEKIPYIKSIGVDIIWLNPVYDSPNDDNGYDIRDYKNILTEFGSLEDLQELLNKLHENGIRLVMDLVVNHCSDEHEWFVKSKQNIEPYNDYFIWEKGKKVDGEMKEPTNWASFFSGSTWEYVEERDEYYLHLFSKKQPDLNWKNEAFRLEVYEMMKYWLDMGVDGFRMDVINLIHKESFEDGIIEGYSKYADGSSNYMNKPKVHEYLQEMNKEVLSKYDVMTVGETPGVTAEDGAKYSGEDRNELSMIFTFEHMDLANNNEAPFGKFLPKPVDVVKLKEILSKWQIGLHGKGWNSIYMNNHDQPRMVSRFGDDKNYRKQSAKMLATLTHTLSGTPYIYQGEEIGMTNVNFDSIDDYRDIEIINAYKDFVETGRLREDTFLHGVSINGRDNSRTPMQWDNKENASFTKGTPWIKLNPNYVDINVEEANNDENSVLNYYRKMISLRKKTNAFIYGKFELLLPDNKDIFAYTKEFEGEKYIVVLNFSKNDLEIGGLLDLDGYTKVFGNYDNDDNGKLLPYESKILKL